MAEAQRKAEQERRTTTQADTDQANWFNVASNIVSSGGTPPESVLSVLNPKQLDTLDSVIGAYNQTVAQSQKANADVAAAANSQLNVIAPPLTPQQSARVAELQQEMPTLPEKGWPLQRDQRDVQAELNSILRRETARSQAAQQLLRSSDELQKRVTFVPGRGFVPVEIPTRAGLPGMPNRPVPRSTGEFMGPEPAPGPIAVAVPPMDVVAPMRAPASATIPSPAPEPVQAAIPMMAEAPAMDSAAFQSTLSRLPGGAQTEALRALRESLGFTFDITPAQGMTLEQTVQQLLVRDPSFLERVNMLPADVQAQLYSRALKQAAAIPAQMQGAIRF